MDDEVINADEPQAEPYAFLYELGELDHTTGLMTQTDLGHELNRVEGVIRGAVKALSKAVPLDRLKEGGKGKLTKLGVALVTACVNRGDITLEAWVHGLMEALKTPEFKRLTGEATTETAADIDLSFLGDRANTLESDSKALALRGDTELSLLMDKSKELEQKLQEIRDKEIQAAEEEAFKAELDLLTAAFRGKMRAKKAFLDHLQNLGSTPDI